MDRVGNFEDVAVGGCLYLYSGTQTGILAAAGGPKRDRGLLLESFVLDSAPSGLVRAYNHKGLWKLRFITFRLCSEGAQLTIHRPGRRRADRTVVPNASQDLKSRWEEDANFAAACTKDITKQGSNSVKVDMVLRDFPITVRKLSLTADVAGVARKDLNFSLKCSNGVRGVMQRAELPFVIQVCLERTGLLEFCGRDAEHMETWIERIKMVSIVHRSFHQTHRTIRNVAQYPAVQDQLGEFSLSVSPKNPKEKPSPPMEALLSVKQSAVGFAIWLIAEKSGSRRYFRVAFDEAPLLLAECAVLSAIEVSPEEHDQCLLASSSATLRNLFECKRSVRVRVERPSFGTLGKMFYYNKWCAFVSTFCRHYEGTVEDRQLHLPSAASFAFSGTRRSRNPEDADDTTAAASSAFHSDDEDEDEKGDANTEGSRKGTARGRRKVTSSAAFGDVAVVSEDDEVLSESQFEKLAGSPQLEEKSLKSSPSMRRGTTPPPAGEARGSSWRRDLLTSPRTTRPPSPLTGSSSSLNNKAQRAGHAASTSQRSVVPSSGGDAPRWKGVPDALLKSIEAQIDADTALCAEIPLLLAQRNFIGVVCAVDAFHSKFSSSSIMK